MAFADSPGNAILAAEPVAEIPSERPLMPAFLTTADPTSGRSRWLVALFLTAAAGAALAVDLPLEKWILAGGLPRWLTKICSLSEIFAHGFGVLLVAAILVALDHERRAAVVRVLAAAFGAGLCANIVKLLVARASPSL